MNECPACGATIPMGPAMTSAACPTCGHDLTERTRVCASCRATISADSDACPRCGQLARTRPCAAHRDREAGAQCALCGTPICEDCDGGARPYHRCPDHADVPIIQGWAQILSLPDAVEAQLVEENLRADGLDVRVLDQKDHSAFPFEFGDLARVRVFVPTFDYPQAEEILAGHRGAAGDVRFGCPRCGEPYGEGDRVCAVCGEALA